MNPINPEETTIEIASDKEVAEISEMLLQRNAEIYKELAK